MGQFGLSPITGNNIVQPAYIVDIVGGSAQNDTSLGYVPPNIYSQRYNDSMV